MIMDEREIKIIDAAIAMFSRYGVKRTTMNDIASEAGIVRQTLYNVYANKNEILRAAIRLYTDRALEAIEIGCADTENLGNKLDIVFKHLVVVPFELIHANSHADEIISDFNASAKEEIAIADQRCRAIVETLLLPYKKQIQSAGLSPRQLAELIQKSCVGFKHKSDNKRHLLELLNSLKILVLTLTDRYSNGENETVLIRQN